MMKLGGWIAVVVFVGCGHRDVARRESTSRGVEERFATLPELPAQMAERLEPAPIVPVLETAPVRLRGARAKTAAPPNASRSITEFKLQAEYPLVSCHPPSSLFEQEIAQVTMPTGARSNASKQQFYRLSAYKAAPLVRTFGCRVIWGPWLGIATEKGACSADEAPEWELVVGTPDIALSWWGTWADRPPVESLTTGSLIQTGVVTECCPGFQLCNGACKQVSLGCSTPGPA